MQSDELPRLRGDFAGYVGLEERIERSVIAHPSTVYSLASTGRSDRSIESEHSDERFIDCPHLLGGE